MKVRRAYLLCSDPQVRLAVEHESLQVEYGTLQSEPASAAETWVISSFFRPADPLLCSEEQFEHAFAGPLRFCMQAAQLALSAAQRPKRIVVVGVCDMEVENSLADCGVAALFSLARSLSIECRSLGISVNGIAMSLSDSFPVEVICGDTLPEGCCLRRQVKNAPQPRPALLATPAKHASHRRVSLVTGAARGLGRAIAQRCAARRDSVLLVDCDESSLQKTVQELSAAGGRVAGFAADVSSRHQLQAAAEHALSRWGILNGWINNAGTAVRGGIWQTEIPDFDRVLNTNFKGTLWGSQVACAAMREWGGVVLNMSSTAARTAGLVYRDCYNQYASYAASKAAIDTLTKLLPHLLPSFIRATAIAPGPILTELTESLYPPAQRNELEHRIPLGRLGTVNDIAAAADFLTSAEAAFISGAVLVIDGGLSSWANAE